MSSSSLRFEKRHLLALFASGLLAGLLAVSHALAADDDASDDAPSAPAATSASPAPVAPPPPAATAPATSPATPEATEATDGEESGADDEAEEAPSPTPSPVVVEPPLIRFSGLVQFVEGDTWRLDSLKSRTPLTFKSVLYEGENFLLAKGAKLKLVTRSECVVVIYGDQAAEAQVFTPNGEKPWRIRAETVRAICPSGRKETLSLTSGRFDIDGAEFLLDSRQLLVLRGEVRVSGGGATAKRAAKALPTMRLLANDGKGYRLVKPQPSELDTWAFNNSRRPPIESTKFAKPEKPVVKAPPTWRFIATNAGGTGRVIFDNDTLNRDHLEPGGWRLQTQRRLGEGSLILMANLRDLNANSPAFAPSTTAPDDVVVENSLRSIEVGYRTQHERWWSPFMRFGLGVEKSRIEVSELVNPYQYSSIADYEFYMFTVAAGFDAFYYPPRFPWVGVYAGVDLNLASSLGRKSKTVFSETYSGTKKPNESHEPWSLTVFSMQIMLGAMLQL